MGSIYIVSFLSVVIQGQVLARLTQGFLAKVRKDMFNKMEEQGINFLGDIPLGNIHKSYTMMYLELVRWTADIYYAKRHWEGLIKE